MLDECTLKGFWNDKIKWIMSENETAPSIPMTKDLDPFSMSSPIDAIPLNLRNKSKCRNDLTRIIITQVSTATRPDPPPRGEKCQKIVESIGQESERSGRYAGRAKFLLTYAHQLNSEISDQIREGIRGVTQSRASLPLVSFHHHSLSLHPFRHG